MTQDQSFCGCNGGPFTFKLEAEEPTADGAPILWAATVHAVNQEADVRRRRTYADPHTAFMWAQGYADRLNGAIRVQPLPCEDADRITALVEPLVDDCPDPHDRAALQRLLQQIKLDF